jgi:hypothetical protein
MLKILEDRSRGWDEASKEYKLGKAEVEKFMDQLSHLVTPQNRSEKFRKSMKHLQDQVNH